MTSTERPPAGLEHKSAPAMLAPRPGVPERAGADLPSVTEVSDVGEMTALTAVTGTRDLVGDIISVGAFRRSLRERTPRLITGHDWAGRGGPRVGAR